MWKEVASLFDQKQSHWKSLCFKEISRSVLLELTIKKYPYWRPNSGNDEQLNWKDLYVSWLHWRVLSRFMYHTDVLSEHRSCWVTCLKLVDDSVVVGLHNGEIRSWKLAGDDPFLLSKHRARVTCLEVISVLDGRKEAKSDKKLDYILSTSHDRVVKISYLIEGGMAPIFFDICHHRHSTIMVRAQQSYFATLDESGAIGVFVVSAPNLDGVMPLVNFIAYYQPCAPVLSLGLWGSKVSGMTKKGSILAADFFKGDDTMKVECTPENDTVHVTVVENASSYVSKVNHYEGIEVLQYYLWRSNIFIWITGDHNMLVSLNGNEYHEYNIEKVLNTYPRTALLYGNMLILGMESGSVVMYYFETPEDLLHLDLRCYHWRHRVANKPVISMDIWEKSSGPLLAVLSHTDVHLIEWSCH
ncbi:uncharacterized protein [Hetaerina americana]